MVKALAYHHVHTVIYGIALFLSLSSSQVTLKFIFPAILWCTRLQDSSMDMGWLEHHSSRSTSAGIAIGTVGTSLLYLSLFPF